jgi:hypothetical protein
MQPCECWNQGTTSNQASRGVPDLTFAFRTRDQENSECQTHCTGLAWRNARTPDDPNAFGTKMTSKNMINHIRLPPLRALAQVIDQKKEYWVPAADFGAC